MQAGRHRAARVEFVEGVAERLPLEDEEVDVYLSFVALPYTDIAASLGEAFRVLRPGGRLQVSLHDWRHQLGWFLAALRGLAIKRVLDHAYIVTHSTWLAWTGRCFGRPWDRDRLESFQTQTRTRLLFTAAGFTDVKCYRTARHFVVEAVKPIG
jgi:ubiquinone/menaquinone biosynthesis C-methylase UbiE